MASARRGAEGSGTNDPAAHSRSAGRSASASLGPLPQYLGYRLRQAQISVFTEFIDRIAHLDLRPGQFGTLLVIQANPGLSQAEVCAALEFHPANFAPMIASLERRGLVERRQRSSDRRSNSLRLAPAGETLLRQAIALQVQHEAEVAERLGPGGKDALVALLARITTR
ncbi:MAG: winged helix-turn-helix transcriptional regulator [Gammaproteobacteria bacterium]|nr:winged helix-turn-helix transcriptional regulator [Gammaproteobacteria bacterium]